METMKVTTQVSQPTQQGKTNNATNKILHSTSHTRNKNHMDILGHMFHTAVPRLYVSARKTGIKEEILVRRRNIGEKNQNCCKTTVNSTACSG